MTLLVLSTHPVQYHAPVYRTLQADFGVQTTVIYASDFSVEGYVDKGFGATFAWDIDLLSGYRCHFLSRVSDGGAKNSGEVSAKGVGKLIEEINPSAILLTGYRPRFDMRAFVNARRANRPLFFRAEAMDAIETQQTLLKKHIRDSFLRYFYSKFDKLLFIGDSARQHYLRLGVPENKLVFSPYCVNQDTFALEDAAHISLRKAGRAELRIDDSALVIIVSGKLIRRKSPDLILRSLKLLPSHMLDGLVVVFLGDGELRSSLEVLANKSPQIDTRFVGFQNQSHLSKYYHAADMLVLASKSEPWGLVVNEAMHHGIPCVVSDRVGCAPDLIVQGVTGYVFPYGSELMLSQMIIQCRTLASKTETRDICREHASVYSVFNAAKGVMTAYEDSVRKGL